MINFPFGTNGKLIILRVPIIKHIAVDSLSKAVLKGTLLHVYSVKNLSQGLHF